MLTDFDGTVLRAEYSAEKTSDGWNVWLESGGGGRTAKNARNPDHARALVVILERLKSLGASLDDALVDSRNTRRANLSDDQRRVLGPRTPRPIALDRIDDIPVFALELRTNGAAVQRTKDHGGNTEKRLQLRVRLPVSYVIADLITLLASEPSSSSRAYMPANEDVSLQPPKERGSVDFEALERGLRGHNRTQNDLARFLADRGFVPFSPGSNDPNFDLAWFANGTLFVAEVKSTTALNEERQLRLGVGQVLRFAQQLGRDTRPVLVAENPPTDATWSDLCQSAGITLCWPGNFERAL